MSSSHNLATLAGGNYCIDQIMFIKFELVKNVCDCRLFLVLYVMNHFRFIFNNCLLLIMVEIEKVEAIFQRVKGVEKVVSGYMGGHIPNPTYERVCNGNTGHAEVIQITFKPSDVSFKELLDVFWKCHDPTQLNRQGHDIGTQYRSAIFYHDETQKQQALESKEKAQKDFTSPIVTEITAASEFYPAEEYHQNYFNLNEKRNPYCKMIRGKLNKLNMK
nr:unnamed protein product [Naegleria fowleri]